MIRHEDTTHAQMQAHQAGTDRPAVDVGLDLMQKMLDAMRDLVDRTALSQSLLEDVSTFFRTGPPPIEAQDIFKIVTLYKQGQGSNWMPNKEHRQYIRVYAPVTTAVDVFSSLGPSFLVTIPPATLPGLWNAFDFPDQSYFYLDVTAPNNQMNIFVRLTNIPNLM